MPSLTFVCCIEAGWIEVQTLRMIESLRRFGGRFSQLPLIAVIPRFGAPLRRETTARLHELGVQLVKADPGTNYLRWLGYSNKVAAVMTAQRLAQTATIAWTDSDILYAQAPEGLELAEDCDFAARCEHLPPAVYDHDRSHAPYWQAVCALFGVDFDSVPWIDLKEGKPPQKMYFNSGLFVWRRSSGFAEAYAAAFRRILDSRIAQPSGAFHFADQVVIMPVILAQGFRWRHLERNEHFMIFEGFVDGPDAAPAMTQAQVIHYSKSFNPPHRAKLLARLEKEVPELHAWVVSHERPTPRNDLRRPLMAALKMMRGLRYRAHGRRVIVVSGPGGQPSA